MCFGFQYAHAYEELPNTCNLFDGWRPEDRVSHILNNPLLAAHSIFQTVQLSLMGINSSKAIQELKEQYPNNFIKDLDNFENALTILYFDTSLSHPYFLLIKQNILQKFEELRKFFLHTSFDQLQDLELVTRKLAELKKDLRQHKQWSLEIKTHLKEQPQNFPFELDTQPHSVPLH